MVDFLTNTALASYLNCFELLGVDDKALETMLGWSKNRSVTFRLAAEETCSFDRKEKRKIEGPTTVTETKGVFGKGVKKEKVVAKVTDYFWKFTVSYEFFVYKGNNPNEKVFVFFVPVSHIYGLEFLFFSSPLILLKDHFSSKNRYLRDQDQHGRQPKAQDLRPISDRLQHHVVALKN
jgi:hypothetical protein